MIHALVKIGLLKGKPADARRTIGGYPNMAT
jgi:hypothetical protein